MKWLLLICILAVQSFFSSPKTSAACEARLKIKVHLVIGSGRLGCESGFGICPYVTLSGKPGSGRIITAECMLENDVLHVFMLKEYISSELMNELLQSRTFNVTDDQEVPQYVLENLKMQEQKTILAGNYPIHYENDYMLVKLPVE